jgi:hypothetical protein
MESRDKGVMNRRPASQAYDEGSIPFTRSKFLTSLSEGEHEQHGGHHCEG